MFGACAWDAEPWARTGRWGRSSFGGNGDVEVLRLRLARRARPGTPLVRMTRSPLDAHASGKRAIAAPLFVDEVDGGFGGGAGYLHGGGVEGGGGEEDFGVVGEAEAFFGDAEHVVIELVVGVFVVQGDDGVAAGRDLQGDGGGGSGEGVGAVWKDLSLFSGQPSGELKMERPASPFWLRKPSTWTMRVQVVAGAFDGRARELG